DALAALCPLNQSDPIGASEQQRVDENHAVVARRGRAPGLQLNRNGRPVELRAWALELIDSMRGLCELLDEGEASKPYTAALELQEAKVRDPGLTPSARSLEELRSSGESFVEFALRMSRLHKSYFLELYPPNEQRLAEFASEAEESVRKQRDLEASDRMTFDQYLANYFDRSVTTT